MNDELNYRPLDVADLVRIGDIDRTERINARYVQHGVRLEKEVGDFSSPPWGVEGDGEHSVAHQRAKCERYLAAGGTALGAFAGERLVGIGVVVPGIRPGLAQLAYLHVSNAWRARGVGGRLARALEGIARAAGDATVVVSATRSLNTVAFYMGLGFQPMAEPLPELFELEPEDIHMRKELGR